MKNVDLDDFEKEIEDSAQSYVKASEKSRRRVKKIISKANEKNRITLRLNNQTIELIKKKALDEGLPYQVFISSILHKYATDKLIEEKAILASIRLLK